MNESSSLRLKANIKRLSQGNVDPCDLDSINLSAMPLESLDLSGVYLLIEQGRVVYVGQSFNPEGRIIQHTKGREAKSFDSFHIIRCKHECMNDLEMMLIIYYQPALNGLTICNRGLVLFSSKQANKFMQKCGSSWKTLARWRKSGLISPVGSYGNLDYYLSEDLNRLAQEQLDI